MKGYSMQKSYKAEPAGFSLVELAICCALLGLLALVCVQNLQGIVPAARVNRAIREVIGLLEWARWSAVRHGSVFKVTVDAEEGILKVFKVLLDEDGKQQPVLVREMDLGENHPGVVFGTADGVVRTSGCQSVDVSGIHLKDHALRFLPSGTVDRCGSLYLIPEQDIPHRRDRMRAVSILLSTGRLQPWTYNPIGKSDCKDDGVWQPL